MPPPDQIRTPDPRCRAGLLGGDPGLRVEEPPVPVSPLDLSLAIGMDRGEQTF